MQLAYLSLCSLLISSVFASPVSIIEPAARDASTSIEKRFTNLCGQWDRESEASGRYLVRSDFNRLSSRLPSFPLTSIKLTRPPLHLSSTALQ